MLEYFSWNTGSMKALLLEAVTFNHFSDLSWVGIPFMMSLTTMRAGEQYGCCLCFRCRMSSLVVSLDRTHVTETVQCCLPSEDSLSGCWGGQGSCELVLRRTSYS